MFLDKIKLIGGDVRHNTCSEKYNRLYKRLYVPCYGRLRIQEAMLIMVLMMAVSI